MEHESTGRPITPPGGLAIGGYEVYRNQLKRDRVREYRESLLKVTKQWPSFPFGRSLILKYFEVSVNVYHFHKFMYNLKSDDFSYQCIFLSR